MLATESLVIKFTIAQSKRQNLTKTEMIDHLDDCDGGSDGADAICAGIGGGDNGG